tara:strand:- start:272 stop:463 length:192 start_codon:yes stop_codon:yes gene_type:complete
MTAKEKANELVDKFRLSPILTDSYVKAIAKTAVDEIIEALENNAANSASWLYYEEVKQEIEKL